jgi:actin-like ATPase involved in cell morphogenesis
MRYWLGIDVGTTFTAAAVCREQAAQGRVPEVVPLGTRSTAVSSVLYLGEDGQILVGETAERRAVTDPDRVVREFKRRIGDEVPMVIGGLPRPAPEMAAIVARWVVDRVAEREGGPPAGIVLTHPASWGPYKVQIMADALHAVGLPNITFRTEPEAAAAGYALQERVADGSTIAVYDLGGGTFDATVVRKTAATSFRVLGVPQGIERLGGADFDDAVFRHVLTAVPALTELDPEDPAVLAATAALRRECTEAKEALSADTEVTIPVLAPGVQAQVRLVRAEFEDMIHPQVAETIEVLRQALRSAEVDPQDLHAVLLVGGSSRVPLVAQAVSAELGRPVAVDADPKAAIALGAAWSALPAAPPEAAHGAVPAAVSATASAGSAEPEAGECEEERADRPALTAIPLEVEPVELEWRRARVRQVKRVALAGALALITAAGVASVPLLTSRGGPVPPAAAGTAPAPTPSAPDAPASPAGNTPQVNPATDSGPTAPAQGSGGAARAVPVSKAAAGKPRPAGNSVAPAPAPPPANPNPTWVTTYTWTSTWSSPPSPAPSASPTTEPTPTAPPDPLPTPVPTTKAEPPPATTTTIAPSTAGRPPRPRQQR